MPTGELFRAMQSGTIDAVQSDDDSMASPTEVTVFGGYFPFGTRYSLDVPVLFNHYGLNEIWEEEYAKVGVKHVSRRRLGPVPFRHQGADPTASRTSRASASSPSRPPGGSSTQFGVVPVTLPWEDVEVAVQTGELDGIAWSGITEDYTVGWADVTNYFLTNNISGAWIGHFFANMDRWNELPDRPEDALQVCMRPVALLPPVVVLGRRGRAARQRRQDGADHDPRRRMGHGRGRRAGLLGRDRGRRRDQGARSCEIFKRLQRRHAKRPGRPYRYS